MLDRVLRLDIVRGGTLVAVSIVAVVGRRSWLRAELDRTGQRGDSLAGNERARKRGTGTTVAAIRVDDAAVTVAWVGDCRVYELQAGRVDRVTVDHIMANEPSCAELVASADESLARILLRAVGIGSEVVVDIRHRPRSPGALYLIASDGLTVALSDVDIHRIVGDEALPLQARCDALVEAADTSGGHDNVTVALVRPL